MLTSSRPTIQAEAPKATTSSVFSMFGGGPKKEKEDDEDRGDNSGSAKAQRDAAAAAAEKKDVEVSLLLRARVLMHLL